MEPGVAAMVGFVAANVATFLVANVSGLLTAMAYIRSGGWRATFWLPVTVGPVVALTALLAQEAGRGATGPRGCSSTSVLAVVVAAAMAVVYDRLDAWRPGPPEAIGLTRSPWAASGRADPTTRSWVGWLSGCAPGALASVP